MFRKRNPPAGSRPGAYVIDPEAVVPKVHVIAYTAGEVNEYEAPDYSELPAILDSHSVTWIEVQGLGDERMLRKLAEIFGLHELAVADVVNVPQRPKVESYDEHLFLITRMATLDEGAVLTTEQLGIFLGRNYVLSFQEWHGDTLMPLRAHIHAANGSIRHQAADYLAYAMLDTVIDSYYPVLEDLGEYFAELEDEALERPGKATLRNANRMRNILLTLRRNMWPQREAINTLMRDDSPLISDTVKLYLRDCHDHCIQIAEVVESYREIVSSIANTYLSSVSNKTNDVMKVLTIMASIFIPLTFMAGIYGMNFDAMPELHYRYSYPLLWFAMAVVAAGMLIYFRRRGWLGSSDRDEEE